MKDLMKTNVYDVEAEIIIVGTCLKVMQPKAYEKLQSMNIPIYDVCLENTHVNMAITKLLGMLSRKPINKIIFATVDKSPHCIQLHYIDGEIRKVMPNSDLNIIHYVACNDELLEISSDAIKKSKSLAVLEKENK